jgi:HNH endonuclease
LKNSLREIRTLLDQLEAEAGSTEARALENFNAFEIPSIVSSVVDHLQPLLLPYEAAIYWHLFRTSILATGQPITRASVRGLQKGVILSSSGQSSALSYGSVADSLTGLEKKGALLKVGEPNREGTLYRVRLPEEIEACRERMRQSATEALVPGDQFQGEDFYNVPENRSRVFERDGYICKYCGKQLTRFTATLDHIQPVSEGGENSLENLVTACLSCNSRKTNKPVMNLLANNGENAS